MKKVILGIIAVAFSSSIYSQTWLGSASGTGNTYRSGNVGIGAVTTPSAYLHVQSTGGYQFKLERYQSTGGHNNTLSIFFTNGIGIGAGSAFFQCSNTTTVSDMVFMPTPTTHALILKANGKVLIGDPATVNLNTTNDYKLYVQTGILTEKVKVALTNTGNWADYVFEKNYKLKPLEDVNTFIKLNKHLPGVPSAQELKDAGGFDLGKMDATLLEKIEELTLYTIQLNEKNKELEARLAKLESQK